MKLTTITYDANLPTVQQVNVPTNSDYKVGMKVKRNGSVQSIKPSEFTIYTGEINVIPPTDWNGKVASVTSSGTTMIAVSTNEDTAPIWGKNVKAKDVRFEVSYDDGATWQTTRPNDFAGYVMINDKSAGTNNYVAQMDPRVPKWYLLSGGQVVGEADEITMPSQLWIPFTSQASVWGFTSYPCKFRIVLPYGGYEEQVTYPVDQEKTNGYVTITKASGDNASFKQYGVHIDHGYDFNDYVKQTGFMTSTLPVNFPNTTTAESLGIGGYTLNMDNAAWGFKKSTTGAVDVTDITSWTTPMTYVASGWIIFKWANGNAAVWYGYDNVNGHYMAASDEDGTNIRKVDEITINPSWILSMGTNGLPGTLNNYYVVAYNFQFGTPFTADFKLNVNEFKSQSGDIAETLADGSSVKVDGTYADGTTFSFDFCTK